MTSTNMFQGMDTSAKPSSRVLRPPGGGSSNLFGGYEDDAAPSRRPDKMASKVFAPPEQSQNVPRRSNPPGGKTSGIFGEPESSAQPQKNVPPGGPSSNIFGATESAPVQSPSRSHPNKPKVGHAPMLPEAEVSQPDVKEEAAPPVPTPTKEQPPPDLSSCSSASSSSPPPGRDQGADLKNHEPHLGPKPRSHNRVLNPPGGKSSVVFY
uniref:Uncharacterized protein n=1 Tax=Mola mola TaxID=94237 RepID=A0A3Q3WN22_MOLML